MPVMEPSEPDEEISLREIAADVRSARYRILVIMLVLGAGGVAIGALRDKQYESAVIVAPVASDSGHLGGLSALASQYGDIASMAGISSPASSKKNESVAVLQSELLTEAYIKTQNLLPVLRSRPLFPFLDQLLSRGEDRNPTLWKANQFFRKNVRTVIDDKSTGMITLKITWKDPHLAAKWANDLVKITNTYLRDKAIREAERNIGYLNEQAGKTNILEARQAIYALLKDELDNEMLARGREEYALKVIDPAVASEKPSSLGKVTLALFGLGGGFVISLLVILVRRVIRNAA